MMRQVLYTLLAYLLIYTQVFAGSVVFMAGGVLSETGITCSGSAVSGDNESFEKGAGQFCTTGWVETDADGVINTYDSGFSNCGSHGLSIICDSDTPNTNKIEVDLGADYTDVYFRAYMKLPTLASGQYLRSFITFVNISDSGVAFPQWYNSSGTYQFSMRGQTNSAYYFNLTPGEKYRIEMHIQQNATCTTKIYDSTGNPVASSEGAGIYEVTNTGYNREIRKVVFQDPNSSSSAVTLYFDDIVIDADGATWIGGQSCD